MGMADAYARSTQQPSFVSLHIETGLANGISLLHNAKEGGTPMVVTSANKDIRKLAEGRTQLDEMTRLFTKWSAEVTHPEQIPSVIRRAFTEAKTPPTGPVYVGFSAKRARRRRGSRDSLVAAGILQDGSRCASDCRRKRHAGRRQQPRDDCRRPSRTVWRDRRGGTCSRTARRQGIFIRLLRDELPDSSSSVHGPLRSASLLREESSLPTLMPFWLSGPTCSAAFSISREEP